MDKVERFDFLAEELERYQSMYFEALVLDEDGLLDLKEISTCLADLTKYYLKMVKKEMSIYEYMDEFNVAFDDYLCEMADVVFALADDCTGIEVE